MAAGLDRDRWTIGKGTTYFTFNDEGQLTNINYPSGTTDVSYTYDDAGRLYSMSDDIGTTLFRYTAAGALDYEAGPWSTDKVDYGYTHGRRTSMDVGRPGTTDWSMSYSYDSSMRLDSLTSPACTFDYVYSGSERRVDKIDMPGSLEIDYGYTSSDKRLADSWLKYGVTTKNHHGYTYNVSGWKTEQDLPTGVTATFDHDALGQLTDADDYNTFDFDYAYDDGWNLDFRKVDGVTEQFSVNSLNELDSSPLGSATYDSNGNLTDDGNTEYTYDHADRLTQAEWQDGSDYWRESYSYDGLNRLREIYREHSTNGTTWTFSSEKRLVYDGRLVVQERDGSNNVLAHYTRGLDLSGTLSGAGGIGGILAREWSSNTAFYHSDAGGNVTRLVDSSGNVQATYQYDPYGDLLSQSGTWASDNPYLFSSKRFVGDGLYYYGFRFYNTDLQRWINKDPLGEAGGINLYGFVLNSPARLVDIWGLASWFHWHHDFPQAIFTPEFCDKHNLNIDINDKKWGTNIPVDDHRKIHRTFNREWKDWLADRESKGKRINDTAVKRKRRSMRKDPKYRPYYEQGWKPQYNFNDPKRLRTLGPVAVLASLYAGSGYDPAFGKDVRDWANHNANGNIPEANLCAYSIGEHLSGYGLPDNFVDYVVIDKLVE